MTANNYSIERTITQGCPQGSCSGPGFWNVLYNSLLTLELTSRSKAIAFADDLIIQTRGETVTEAENYANLDLRKIEEWAQNNKMKFNENKSKVMLMSRRDIDIYINNKTLPQVESIKYLGIIFDSKLSFREHITYIEGKCTKLIFSLAKSAKITWGLKHKTLKKIYMGAILPLLLYGAPVWKEVLYSSCYKGKLIRVQRLINIKIAKAYRTVSNEALYIVTGLIPINIKIEEAAKYYAITKDKGEKYDREMDIKNWKHPAKQITIIDAKEDSTHNIQAYTDGSKSEAGVGSGIAVFTGGNLKTTLRHRINVRCTNNQAEQMAILKALEYIQQLNEDNKTALVYTYSRITLQILQNRTRHTYIIDLIKKKVINMEQDEWKIEFSWVKAHAGQKGNELEDRLAKEASSNKNFEECYNRNPKSTVPSELRQQCLKQWQTEWETITKGATTKSFFPNIEDRLKL